MPARADLVAALLRPLHRLMPHVERLLGAARPEAAVPAPPAEPGPWSVSEQRQPAPWASTGITPWHVAPHRAVAMPVAASDPWHAGAAPAAGDGERAPRAEQTISNAVVPGAMRRLRAVPPGAIRAREPAPLAAAPPTDTPASLARKVARATAPAGFAPAPAIAAAASHPAPAPAPAPSSLIRSATPPEAGPHRAPVPARAAAQPSRAMLPLPLARRPAPPVERRTAPGAGAPPQPPPASLPGDAGPPFAASIPVLRNARPRRDLGESPAAIASDSLGPRRPVHAQTALDREALEDALADILRDAARREGMDV